MLQLESVAECTVCPSGRFCGTAGSTTFSGSCRAGWYCPAGSVNEQGSVGIAAATHVCPSGSYCPTGSSTPVPCPPGRFSNTTGGVGVTDCRLCEAGQFCGTQGLTSPTGPCFGGYYCRLGNTIPTPVSGFTNASVLVSLDDAGSTVSVNVSVGGALCPPGNFCPNGTSIPVPCPAGTFNPSTGAVGPCTPCPAGFFCVAGLTSYVRFVHSYGPLCPRFLFGYRIESVCIIWLQFCVPGGSLLPAKHVVVYAVSLPTRDVFQRNWTSERI
jgi:hypothetical protein